jgi:hypothetical protein
MTPRRKNCLRIILGINSEKKVCFFIENLSERERARRIGEFSFFKITIKDEISIIDSQFGQALNNVKEDFDKLLEKMLRCVLSKKKNLPDLPEKFSRLMVISETESGFYIDVFFGQYSGGNPKEVQIFMQAHSQEIVCALELDETIGCFFEEAYFRASEKYNELMLLLSMFLDKLKIIDDAS